MKCQWNPNKAFIQNHKHCESVSKGPVGEERREEQGADGGPSFWGPSDRLRAALQLPSPRTHRSAPLWGSKRRSLPQAFHWPLFLKEKSPSVRQHPNTPAGTDPRGHAGTHPTLRTPDAAHGCPRHSALRSTHPPDAENPARARPRAPGTPGLPAPTPFR